MSLRIRTIARLTGVREGTLRAWERRHGFPRPQRGSNNYRAYEPSEVVAISRVAKLLEQGLSVSEAIAQVRSEQQGERPTLELLKERFWAAVAMLDSGEAEQVLDQAEEGRAPLVLCDEVLIPLLGEMSMRLDVAQEHLASAAIRERLRRILRALPEPRARAPLALLASGARDTHEGGLLALAIHLRSRNWSVTILGADTPAEAIASALTQLQPAIVAISFGRHWDDDELSVYLREVVECCGSVPVVAGGGGVRNADAIVRNAGAHFADSPDALIAVYESRL